MPQLAAPFEERNRELGQLLLTARSSQHISITTCAELIGTSRRRYAAMEQGEAMIRFAEFVVLVAFLHIPYEKIGGPLFSPPLNISAGGSGEPGQLRVVHLQASLGVPLHIVVTVEPT